MTKSELLRKAIHFSGLLYIPAIYYLGKDVTWQLVLALTTFAVVLEALRTKFNVIPDILIREYEKRRIAGYLYTGVAFSIITPVFSDGACISAAACSFAGDGVSGIVKKVNGSYAIALFVLSSIAVSLISGLEVFPSVLAAIISSTADGKRINDNLTIPLLAAITYEAVTKF